MNEEIEKKILALQEKYQATGQDLNSYLEGLIHADYLDYWAYINLDVLLNLQHPRTAFPDENIFIIYHQITELYFKLILQEIHQLCNEEHPSTATFLLRLTRMNNYFQHLSHSFEIMIHGMEKEQFLKFRMALLPASGFQSAQIRLVELCATEIKNLVAVSERGNLEGKSVADMLQLLYWRKGATELETGKKTFTLRRFEQKYDSKFLETAEAFAPKNIWIKYKQAEESVKNNEEIKQALRKFDLLVNVEWRLAHLRSISRYMKREPEDLKATGGTNWQKYLPPNQQRLTFFPDLFSKEELENWGTN